MIKNIGLILPSSPGYSEVFIINKILGLLEGGFEVSLFVGGKNRTNKIPESVPIYYQVDISHKFHLFYILSITIILHPIRCYRFLYLERASKRCWISAIKNLIINSHIIGKSLDWIHFGFTTAGIGRENLARSIKAKSAVSFRGFDIGIYPHQHPGCYNLLWKRIDKVHTISDDLYQKALDLGLNPKTPYKKITPAISIEFFKSSSLKNLHKPLRILTVGRLHWKKGYEYALKALSLLKRKKFDFEYHIAGEGNQREAIMFGIHQLKLNENVKLQGQLTHDEIKLEMEWADIYIQPSIQEGFCNAVLEAQAMGLLCIVTNAEGLSENVLNEKTGWVVSKRSAEHISDAITKIINLNINQLNIISQNAIERVGELFNINDYHFKWSAFYRDM